MVRSHSARKSLSLLEKPYSTRGPHVIKLLAQGFYLSFYGGENNGIKLHTISEYIIYSEIVQVSMTVPYAEYVYMLPEGTQLLFNYNYGGRCEKFIIELNVEEEIKEYPINGKIMLKGRFRFIRDFLAEEREYRRKMREEGF